MSNTDDLNLTADEQFFFDHAGWSHDPLTESPREGRARCAQALAAAEVWARYNGYGVEWEDDGDGDHSYLDQPEFAGQDIWTCEHAGIYNEDGNMLAGIGCVDNATPEYRRVVAAELALELFLTGVPNG